MWQRSFCRCTGVSGLDWTGECAAGAYIHCFLGGILVSLEVYAVNGCGARLGLRRKKSGMTLTRDLIAR